jgi:hypothetical protein
MKISSLACGVACLALATPIAAQGQSLVPVADFAPYGIAAAPPLVEPPIVAVLPPYEIAASVRSAGFDPVSRPLHRGRVYVVFAIDRDDADVRLTVDARSGRVLSVTRLAGEVFDEPPGYDGGYAPPSRVPQGYVPPYERPPHLSERGPVPPADVPGYEFDYRLPRAYGSQPIPQGDIRLLPRERSRSFDQPTHESMRRTPSAPVSRPPVPRARPGDMVTGAARPSAPQAPTAPPVAAPPPAPADVQAAPPPPGMVPVAPLE